MKRLLSILFAMTIVLTTLAQNMRMQIVDEGGSGRYKAIMTSDQSLLTHTVFRPQRLRSFGKNRRLPIVVWGNGACANSPNEHVNFLNEIASHGFLVIAIGPMPDGTVKELEHTKSSLLTKAIDWAILQNTTPTSPYYGKLDTTNIAAAGMSCGGLQVLDICEDKRLKTIMVCNSGLFIDPLGAMPNMPMPTKDKLKNIHTPVLYLLGGKKDIAYENGMDDFRRIYHVPAVVCNLEVGHAGTYAKQYGGDFGVVASAWMEWQLKGDEQAAKMFKGTPCGVEQLAGWTIDKVGIDGDDVWIKRGKHNIYGVLSKPNGTGRQPIAIIAHGFNGTHAFGRNYFDLFKRLGYQCFSFDFPSGSVYSRSDNNTMEMSIIDEQQSLETVVDYFKRQPDVDTTRIVLVGESQGGLVSALVAASRSKDISQLVLIYPALCIPDNWNDRYSRLGDIPDTTAMWGVKLGRRFFTEIRHLNVFDVIDRYDRPVLIVHGNNDKVVPIDYSRHALTVYPNARLHTINGAGHGFKPDELKESMIAIEQFLDTTQTRLDGFSEVLCINITDIDSRLKVDCQNGCGVNYLSFSGTCNSRWFKGTVLPGGYDCQKCEKGQVTLSARYMLEGIDCAGDSCRIFIENNATHDSHYSKPQVFTDSRALDFLNTSELLGVLDSSDKQFRIRIYVRR